VSNLQKSADAEATSKVEAKPTENGAASEQEKQQEQQVNGDDKTSAPAAAAASEEANKAETSTTESTTNVETATPAPAAVVRSLSFSEFSSVSFFYN